jgi:hypothetical protein
LQLLLLLLLLLEQLLQSLLECRWRSSRRMCVTRHGGRTGMQRSPRFAPRRWQSGAAAAARAQNPRWLFVWGIGVQPGEHRADCSNEGARESPRNKAHRAGTHAHRCVHVIPVDSNRGSCGVHALIGHAPSLHGNAHA